MVPLPLSSNSIERFRRDLAVLGFASGKLGLAVSGGPDSLALLLLASSAFPGSVEAATVDHRLRPEGGLEALHVEDICGRIGCPHSIIDIEVPGGPGGLQAEARAARYAALRHWARERGIAHLATAHHEDDQAETVLMRLQRGSGVSGLGGIRPVRMEGELLILRPLLGWSKSELVHLVASAGVEAVDDPSNRDPRFDRAAMRRFLSHNPQFEAKRLARTAAAMREADDGLGWAAEQLHEDRVTSAGGEWRIEVADLPREFRRRLLSRTIRDIRSSGGLEPRWSGSEDVEPMLAALEQGQSATLGGVMARGGFAWHLRLAPPRRPTRKQANA